MLPSIIIVICVRLTRKLRKISTCHNLSNYLPMAQCMSLSSPMVTKFGRWPKETGTETGMRWGFSAGMTGLGNAATRPYAGSRTVPSSNREIRWFRLVLHVLRLPRLRLVKWPLSPGKVRPMTTRSKGCLRTISWYLLWSWSRSVVPVRGRLLPPLPFLTEKVAKKKKKVSLPPSRTRLMHLYLRTGGFSKKVPLNTVWLINSKKLLTKVELLPYISIIIARLWVLLSFGFDFPEGGRVQRVPGPG